MKIERCTSEDLVRIQSELERFWGDRQSWELHHPLIVREFPDSCFVIRLQDVIVCYLLGMMDLGRSYGYIHLVAVRDSQRRRGLARRLYEHFFDLCRAYGARQVKAIVAPGNAAAIAFHRRMGFRLFGETIERGVPVMKNYGGPGKDRVILLRPLPAAPPA